MQCQQISERHGRQCKREKHDDSALHIYPSDPSETTLSLPTQALIDLRIAWERDDDATFRERSLALVRDVFGGQDGHLVRLDDALGLS